MTDMPISRLVDLPLRGLVDGLADGAVCQGDPDLWTGPDAFTIEPQDAQMAREDVAREVCETDCPVWDLCLEYALRTKPVRGIWAGLSAHQVRALAKDVRAAATAADPGVLGEVA